MPNDPTVTTVLSRLLVDSCSISSDQIHPDATLDELGLDSLSRAELAMQLQDTLGVSVTDGDLPQGASLRDIESTLRHRLSGQDLPEAP